MEYLLNWMKKNVTHYIFTPLTNVEPFSVPYQVMRLYCDSVRSRYMLEPDMGIYTSTTPQPRNDRYWLQAVRIGEMKKQCKRVLIFIKGMGNHLFLNNRRFEEIMHNMGDGAVGYSCNPYGVYNNLETLSPCAYTPQQISLHDVVDDYKHLVTAVLMQHPGAELTIVGHSAGGLFAKLLGLKLASSPIKDRLKCLYTSVSFNSVCDFVDKLTVNEMFKAKATGEKYFLAGLNAVGNVSNSILRMFVKATIRYAQWGDRVVDVDKLYPPGFVYYANLIPKFDMMIGDLATVIKDGPYTKLLVPSDVDVDEAHSLPPSELQLLTGETEQAFLQKLLAKVYSPDNLCVVS